MHTLSIKQPWAFLLCAGLKDIENRTWPTHYRGPVLIHAGKTTDKGAYDWIYSNIPDPEAVNKLPVIDTLPKGGIVGITNIIDCVANSQSKWFGGPWGFVVKNSRPLPFLPVKGQLKIFQIPYQINESGVLMPKKKVDKKVKDKKVKDKKVEDGEITKREDTLMLPVKLTAEDLTETMDELVQKLSAVDNLEEELADIKKDYGKSIKQLHAEISSLARNYREKTKEDEIECIIEYSWSKGIKRITRKAGGEVLQEKDITEEDRQEKLDLEDHGKAVDGSATDPKIKEGKTPEESKKDGKVLEIIDNEPGTDVEVRNGVKWVVVPFAGLKKGQVFRLVKDGKTQTFEGKEIFNAIGDPEQKGGFWKISVV